MWMTVTWICWIFWFHTTSSELEHFKWILENKWWKILQGMNDCNLEQTYCAHYLSKEMKIFKHISFPIWKFRAITLLSTGKYNHTIHQFLFKHNCLVSPKIGINYFLLHQHFLRQSLNLTAPFTFIYIVSFLFVCFLWENVIWGCLALSGVIDSVRFASCIAPGQTYVPPTN